MWNSKKKTLPLPYGLHAEQLSLSWISKKELSLGHRLPNSHRLEFIAKKTFPGPSPAEFVDRLELIAKKTFPGPSAAEFASTGIQDCWPVRRVA